MIDGHTHTEVCPHGSGDKTAKMLERAIDLGIKKYCLTEHAPLPKEFWTAYTGCPDGIETAALKEDQVTSYLSLGQELRREYGKYLKISIGFEVDYLPGFEKATKAFLDQVGPQTDENILSVHFMKGFDGGFWCIDYNETEFSKAFAPWIHDQQALYGRYFELVQASLDADLGIYRPVRIGHMDLIKKYQHYFHYHQDLNQENMNKIYHILKTIKVQGRQLDLNYAGLSKPYCLEEYPSQTIQNLAKSMNIPMITGSDAHSIDSLVDFSFYKTVNL